MTLWSFMITPWTNVALSSHHWSYGQNFFFLIDGEAGAESLPGQWPRKRPAVSPIAFTLSASGSSDTAQGKNKAEEAESDEGVFWDGELRQTAIQFIKAKRPVWNLSEIIGDRGQILQAIVSSYVVEIDWLRSFFLPSTPLVLVDHPAQAGSGIRSPTVQEVRPNMIRMTPFFRSAFGVQHMKFMLIFYKSGRLRIVISTANLVAYDWCDIENSAWVQDVPRRTITIAHDAKADDFPTTLERVLECMNVAPALASFLYNGHPELPLQAVRPGALRTRWDFSRVQAHLVASIAGKHEGWEDVLRVGHTALWARGKYASTSPDGPLAPYTCADSDRGAQGSSIGTYSTQWLNEFYTSAAGKSLEDWLDMPKTRRAKLPWPNVQIVYPTLEWVRKAVGGEKGGGTLFCRRKQWEGAKFPQKLFVQSRSKQGRVLMHSKMIIATLDNPNVASDGGGGSESETEQSDDELVAEKNPEARVVGWTYVGSHNFTPSAWGTLSGSKLAPVMNIANYELGVVLPLHSEAEAERASCFERPLKKYSEEDLPWMQEESQV
ncbi:hypothetical protein EVG20_g7020 [Dentipellis fragilis]|uniref:PLD phosphodiesterase domain-containing protein n=1 Tax=Dentipellis fragilis TaxID=205917 RepID=A0A4Y9YI49_9AGAM|nr:hypothetical protein EVG20_g7020 [Dentipellis fragilis]